MNKLRRTGRLSVLLASMLFMAGCSAGNTDSQETGYKHISQEEAKEMMEKDDNHIIVDVRRQDEFDEGHIPEAVCIPNESIGTEQPSELPDLNQIILVYCRSGNRSRQASEKLADIGYTNVYDFGGIQAWKGVIVKEDTESIDDAIQPVATLGITSNANNNTLKNQTVNNSLDFQSRSFVSNQEDTVVETIGLAVFNEDKLVRYS